MSFTNAVPKKHFFRLRKNFFFRSARKKGSFHFIVQGRMQKNNFSEPENLSLSLTKETPEKKSGRVFFGRNRGPRQTPALLQPAQRE
jgi:hypothetical protein